MMSGEFVLEDSDLFWADLAAPLHEMPHSLQEGFNDAAHFRQGRGNVQENVR